MLKSRKQEVVVISMCLGKLTQALLGAVSEISHHWNPKQD